MALDVLLVGGGGREHALAWKIKQSPRLRNFYIAPGNAGTSALGENVPIAADDIKGIADFAREKNVNLVVVGPDNPLSLGIVDQCSSLGIKVFGPTKSAARVESSKSFAKELMSEAGIPTAAFRIFSDFSEALDYVEAQKMPVVIKASGLALGKGVYICRLFAEAESALKAIMIDKVHGDAGGEVGDGGGFNCCCADSLESRCLREVRKCLSFQKLQTSGFKGCDAAFVVVKSFADFIDFCFNSIESFIVIC